MDGVLSSSLFYACLVVLVFHLRVHTFGDGRCTITLSFFLYDLCDALVSDCERFRSTEIQLSSTLAQHQ